MMCIRIVDRTVCVQNLCSDLVSRAKSSCLSSARARENHRNFTKAYDAVSQSRSPVEQTSPSLRTGAYLSIPSSWNPPSSSRLHQLGYGQTQKQRNLRPIPRKQARKGKAVDVPSGKENQAGTGAAIQIPHESTRSGYSSHWKESGRSLAGCGRSPAFVPASAGPRRVPRATLAKAKTSTANQAKFQAPSAGARTSLLWQRIILEDARSKINYVLVLLWWVAEQ
jgi:hypothetical protein